MTQLYLVRHGHAAWNTDEMRPLSEQGKVDALRVADLLEEVAPAAIYSSPFPRAKQTVEPLATRLGLVIQELADLRERRLSREQVPDFRAAVRATWEDFGFAHSGGESNRDAQDRSVRACRRLVADHNDEPVVLSTHGNLLALILNAYDPRIGFDFWSHISFPDVYLLQTQSAGRAAIIRRIWPGR